MKLHTLKRSKGIVGKAKRLGRGNGSGKGNYSGKGLKGQKARSGTTTRPFFEGGQTSIVQRIPKAKGFKRHFKLIKEVVIVNLGNLDADIRIVEGMEITKSTLKDLGYIKNATAYVKLLGNGDWTKKVTFVDIDTYSKSAQEKIGNPSAKKPATKKTAEKIEEPKSEKKPAAKKTAEKIEEPKSEKKPVAKKTVAKAEKPAAKKPAAKKPAAKKTSTKKDAK
ncbi:50S ribosomal protein L15 [candidate division SR1 bacterium RAAC1_SR1_1]|nr:50S ribosomal protein L15 [candidate division SR1 bacterium RAAC1_SR1_1]